jgi:hypothetical protein
LEKNAIIDTFFGDESFIDSEMTMFRLEHKDPTLNCLVLGDLFHCIHPTESDNLFNSSHQEKTVMDLLDAVQSRPYLEELVLAVDHGDSILWTEGDAHNALFSVMRDLPSAITIMIQIGMQRLDPVAEMMNHCQHVKYLTIHYDGCRFSGYGMGTLVQSLSSLPVL